MNEIKTNSPLRTERKRLGLSQQQVGEALGITPGNLSRIERGQVPSQKLLRKLLEFYPGLSAEDIVLFDYEKDRESRAKATAA